VARTGVIRSRESVPDHESAEEADSESGQEREKAAGAQEIARGVGKEAGSQMKQRRVVKYEIRVLAHVPVCLLEMSDMLGLPNDDTFSVIQLVRVVQRPPAGDQEGCQAHKQAGCKEREIDTGKPASGGRRHSAL
jgi:hypothetical protein